MKHRNQLFHQGMVVVMALNILACGSAYAHSKQVATFPEDGAVLAAAPDVVSSHGCRNNEVCLQLHALANNLGNFLRTLALGGALVADDASREADQDRHQGRSSRSLYHVPTHRSRNPEKPVRQHPAPD